MLQTIRDNSRGLVAYILLGLLILSFAVWGIDFQFGGDNYLVRVNGEDVDPNRVTRQYQNQLQAYQSAFPNGIPTAQLETLKRDVLMASAREEIVYQHAKDLGLHVSDAALAEFIESQPGFQLGGEFSIDQFSLVAQREGLTVQGMEEYVRRALVGNQLASSLVQTAFITEAERQRRGALENESRVVSHFRVPADRFMGEFEPDEAAIQAEYEADSASFYTPEAVRLEYIQLRPADLTEGLTVDEETVRRIYEDGVENNVYSSEETRKASHILISAPAAADDPDADAEARAQAEELLGQLREGADFAELAAEHSDDPGTRGEGGALDWSPRAAFVGPFSDALFSMAEGDLSEPVRTMFGYHIIRLDGVRAGEAVPFEDVREEIEEEEKLRMASELIDDVSRRLDEAVYDNDATLQPAADETGLEIQETPFITRGSGSGIGTEAIIREAAFSDSVFLDRRNSQALRLDDGYVYIRISEHRPSELQSLDQVRPLIRNRLIREAAATKAADAGRAARERIESGEDIATVAAELEVGLETDVTVERQNPGVDPSLASAVFSAPAPDAEGEATVGSTPFPNGDYGVFMVHGRSPGQQMADAMAARVAQGIGSSEFAAYVDRLVAEAEISIRPEALQ